MYFHWWVVPGLRVPQIGWHDVTKGICCEDIFETCRLACPGWPFLQISSPRRRWSSGAGALRRSMSPNFNVSNINVLHINSSLLQQWVVEVQSKLALPKALQINGSIHQLKWLGRSSSLIVPLYYTNSLLVPLFKQGSRTLIFGTALFEKWYSETMSKNVTMSEDVLQKLIYNHDIYQNK